MIYSVSIVERIKKVPKQKPIIYAIYIAIFFLALILGPIIFPDKSEPVSANLPATTTSTSINKSKKAPLVETIGTTITTTKLEPAAPSTNATASTFTSNVSDATIHFLDTGNSDSILVRQGDHSILIDGADADAGLYCYF